MKDFRDLQVWHKAHALVLQVYKATSTFPREELYGIVSQLRRAAVSIPNNLAEGCGRGGDGDLCRFIQIALGSSSETEYLLLLSRDLAFLDGPSHARLASDIEEIKQMLAAFLRKVQANR